MNLLEENKSVIVGIISEVAKTHKILRNSSEKNYIDFLKIQACRTLLQVGKIWNFPSKFSDSFKMWNNLS